MKTRTFRRRCRQIAEKLLTTEQLFTTSAVMALSPTPEDALLIMGRFQQFFKSETPWPTGDQETRCLAFLLLAEFGRDDEVEELIDLIREFSSLPGPADLRASLKKFEQEYRP